MEEAGEILCAVPRALRPDHVVAVGSPQSGGSAVIRYNTSTKDFTLTLPDDTELSGFDSLGSATHAYQNLRSLVWDLESPLSALYTAFKHPTEDWAFVDREGVLHTTFQTKEEAQNHALKIK